MSTYTIGEAAERSGFSRLAAWRAVLDHARSCSTIADGATRIEFSDDIDIRELAGLVAAEQRWCAFFSFMLTVDPRGVGLEVRAPDGADSLVSDLFGTEP